MINKKHILALILLSTVILMFAAPSFGQAVYPRVTLGVERADSPRDFVVTIQVLAFLTILSLAPSIMVMTTSFTRLIVVFFFMRQAMGTQQVPPGQVIVGLCLFLTFFIMTPTLTQINENALQPYLNEQISQQVAIERAAVPVKAFMLKQTREEDMAIFVQLSKIDRPATPEEMPFHVLMPAFIINELRIAFQIGFILYLPFLIIDMVVASVLLAMGMMMLPPVMISLPFKIILFVLADGWNLIVGSMVSSFG